MVARRLIVAVTALAAGAGLGACGDEYVKGAGVYSTTTTTPATVTTAPGAPAQSTDAGGTEGRETGQLTAADRSAVRAARRAARSFLAGYLPYSYGRQDAGGIRSVTPELRRALVRQTPRVPPALAEKARPRLTKLEVSGIADRERVILLSHIDDGQSRYAALLTVQRRGTQWAVSQVR